MYLNIEHHDRQRILSNEDLPSINNNDERVKDANDENDENLRSVDA